MPNPDFQPHAQAPARTDAKIKELLEISSRRTDARAIDPLVARLLERASVVGVYGIDELVEGMPQSEALERALAKVLERSGVVIHGGKRLWILGPDARRETLARLGGDATRILQSIAKASSEPMSVFLAELLNDNTPDAGSIEETSALRALVNAADWAQSASQVARRNLGAWRAELKRRELVDPLQRLIGGNFVGRDDELKLLRGYVDVVPPSTKFEGWSRWVVNRVTGAVKLPLVVHGVGGIGKSTLMARFIVQHAAVAGERAFPFVLLDFDRGLLDPMNVLTLISEASRQVGAQFPETAGSLKSLRAVLQDESLTTSVDSASGSAADDGSGRTIDKRIIKRQTARFVQFIRDANLADRPFLVILDTFEEVQSKGDAAVDAVFEWLTALSELGTLRTVISGRAAIEGHDVAQTREIEDLKRDPSLQWLANEGIAVDLAKRIYAHVGGNPLSLRLAAQLVAARDDLPIDWTENGGEKLRSALDATKVQGYLYARLLRHIDNEKVRTLAHPGLVLRRITPEIILEVLAPAMGLHVTTEAEARELFEGLKHEITLVTDDGGALVHRRDVRSVMLPLQKKDNEDVFQRINRAAASYYRPRTASQDRVELAYHELMLGTDALNVLKGQRIDLARALGSAVEELPETAALILRVLLSRPLTKAEVKNLPDQAWEAYAFGKAMDIVAAGAPEKALKLLDERAGLRDSVLLAYPRAWALFHLVRWEEADKALAVAAAYRDEPAKRLPNKTLDGEDVEVRTAIERGFLQWYRFRDKEADMHFDRAQELASAKDNPVQAVEALLGHLVVTGSKPSPRLNKMVRDIPMDVWRENLSTLRRLVFLGHADDGATGLALHRLGLRLRSPGRIENFVKEFERELDATYRMRLEQLLVRLRSKASTKERMDMTVEASILESGCVSSLMMKKNIARRVMPYIRGKYAPWLCRSAWPSCRRSAGKGGSSRSSAAPFRRSTRSFPRKSSPIGQRTSMPPSRRPKTRIRSTRCCERASMARTPASIPAGPNCCLVRWSVTTARPVASISVRFCRASRLDSESWP